jgi:serine/threonine protein kinase
MDDDVEIQMGNYVFTQRYCIGQGSYGKVYRGQNKQTGRQVAIKEMDGQLITE